MTESETHNPNTLRKEDTSSNGAVPNLKEGVDYYLENGLMVFTAAFLERRGYCCERGCRHCPYEYAKSDP